MLPLLPGVLLVLEAVVFLSAEVLLRRRSRWREGALDHLTPGLVAGPLVVYLVAAVVLSTAGWDLLRLTGALTVAVLPVCLGAAFRALRGDRRRLAELETTDASHDLRWWRPAWRLHPAALATGLSLAGLLLLWGTR